MIESRVGMTKICGIDCPFSYEQDMEKITVHTGNKSIEIPDGMDKIIGQRLGMFIGGYTLYKLNTPLSNGHMCIADGKAKQISIADQIRSIEYFIDDYQENSSYTEMRFQFSELDYFLPSNSRVTISSEEIVFSRIKDTVYNFDIQYCDSVVSVYFNRIINAHSNVKTEAETISEIVLKFLETDELEYLIDMYSAARRFFTFVCNRQNISFRSTTLIGSYPRKTMKDNKIIDAVGYTKQKLVPSQKYLEPLEDEKTIKKTPNSCLFSDKIKELFQLFFEEKTGDMTIVDVSSIHPSFKYRNLIDLEQSLHTTAAFEHYVRNILPEISSQETIDFFNDIEVLVDGYIEIATGKKKKKAKDFKKTLRPQVSLEDKIIKAYDGYSTWQALKPILLEWFGDDITDLASAANLWRNELAHEKREYQPDKNVINAVRLVEYINYCIIFRCAEYNDEKIKLILSEILSRPI